MTNGFSGTAHQVVYYERQAGLARRRDEQHSPCV